MKVTRKKDMIAIIKGLTEQGLQYVTEFQLCPSVYMTSMKKTIPTGSKHELQTLFLCRQAYTTCQVFTNNELTKFQVHLSGKLSKKNRKSA